MISVTLPVVVCVALPVVCHIIVLVLCLDCLFELNSDALFYFVLVVFINPLALELDIYSLAHHLCKM